MFKAAERVWHIRRGWGVLEQNSNHEYPFRFRSDEGVLAGTYTNDGRFHINDINPSIFYKEQKLDMSKPEPAIGTWGYFWDDYTLDLCTFGKLRDIVDDTHKYIAECLKKGITPMYMNFSPEIPPHIKELMNGTDTSNS